MIDGGAGAGAGVDTLSLSYDTASTYWVTAYNPTTGASVYRDSVSDLTAISLSHVETLPIYGSYTNCGNTTTAAKVNTAALADVTSIPLEYGVRLATEAATLDLSGKIILGYNGGSVTRLSATGTTFTVHSLASAFMVQGGTGQDMLLVRGLTLTTAQRDQVLAGSVKTLADALRTYVNGAVMAGAPSPLTPAP